MGERRVPCRVSVQNLREMDHLKDLSIDGAIILKWILKIDCNDVNWINMAYDRNW